MGGVAPARFSDSADAFLDAAFEIEVDRWRKPGDHPMPKGQIVTSP
jgi:hypothetical protein